LAERGLAVSYETVRRWVNHFGPRIALRSLSWTSSGCCPPSNIGRSIRVEPPFDAFEARLDPVKADPRVLPGFQFPRSETALFDDQLAEFVGAGAKALALIANRLGPTTQDMKALAEVVPQEARATSRA
jgi:hypothetical protein